MSELLSIEEVVETVFGGKLSLPSVRRWIAKGIGRPKVKLPATRIGRVYYVREDDAREFLAALADPELYRQRKRSERVQKAVEQLEAMGA